MKKLLTFALLISLSLTLTGCGLIEYFFPPEEVIETPKEKEVVNEEDLHEPGTIPEALDYPTVGTTAEAGDTVLVPLIEELLTAFKYGTHRGFFTFYEAKMIEPGDVESTIQDYFGDEMEIPNSLIIPIKSDQSVEPGDVVLTVWQSNDPADTEDSTSFDLIGDKSMIRAIVVGDGLSTTPTVRYLTEFMNTNERLSANTFHKLTGELEPGVSVITKDDQGRSEYATVINIAGDKVLLTKTIGHLTVVNKKDLTLLPPTLDLEVGDTIVVPLVSDRQEVTITEISAETGQVLGEFQWAGSLQNDIFYFGEFTK